MLRKEFGIVFLIFFLATQGFVTRAFSDTPSRADRSLLLEQNSLEKEGRRYEKIGDFESAIRKYRQAADMDIEIYGSDKGRPLAFLAEVYEKQGKYEEALKIVRSLLDAHKKQVNYADWVEELETLIQYKKTSNTKLVLDYIVLYFDKYKMGLPPNRYDIDATSKITRILALCDVIGEYDKAIQFIDQILEWAYNKPDGEFKNVKHFKTTTEIGDLYKWKGPGKTDPDWRAYKWIREYLLVREAFEKDKKEGTKESASKVLIQSDYFPW